MAHYDITDFDGADLIDIRDVITRVEELREELQQKHEDGQFMSEFSDWIKNSVDNSEPIHAAFKEDGEQVQSDIEELAKLESLLEDLCGYGGDEQWEGNWYPVSLIKDTYFETAMDELLEDIGDIPKNIPSYLKIVVDYDALKQDYSEVEFEGNTYYYR